MGWTCPRTSDVGRRCSVCQHPEVFAVNEAIVAGASFRDVARQYTLSHDAVTRHAAKHLPAALMKAAEAQEVASADKLMAKVNQLETDARRIGREAEAGGDLRAALAAVGQLVKIVELEGRLLGELNAAVNVSAVAVSGVSPEFVADVRGRLAARLDHMAPGREREVRNEWAGD